MTAKNESSIIVPGTIKPPAMATITPVNKVLGDQPPAWNLRDHPELDGMQFIITKFKVSKGDQGDYLIMDGYRLPAGIDEPRPEDRLIVITGSSNVLERVLPTVDQLPVMGKFRKSGRAWFFD